MSFAHPPHFFFFFLPFLPSHFLDLAEVFNRNALSPAQRLGTCRGTIRCLFPEIIEERSVALHGRGETTLEGHGARCLTRHEDPPDVSAGWWCLLQPHRALSPQCWYLKQRWMEVS